jgi:hypothetical protein
MSTTRDDVAMRAAFAPARGLEPTDAEVARVLARARGGRRRRFREHRLVAAALFAGLIVAAGTAAATGLLPVGSVIPLSKNPQGDGLTYVSDRTVVATGRTETAGRWRMSVANSNLGSCFAIELVDQVAPGSRGPMLAEGCGGAGGTFDAASLGGGTLLPDATLVYGPAPEGATAVRVTAEGFSRTTRTHEGPADIPGDFYAVEIPRKGLRNALVKWLDTEGHTHEPGIYVPSTIDYSSEPATPDRPQ